MNKIKYYREKINLTQESLARICDISLGYMQKLEYGKNVPTIYLALKIKKALHVENIEDLFPED
jgi:DNA-binding XRE family transcriptional regulator